MELAIGTRIGKENRYRIARELFRSGAAIVYEGEDEHLGGRKVTIKVCRDDSAPSLRRFEREKAALFRLRHTGIVELLDHGNDWIVLGHANGKPLRDYLVELRGKRECFEARAGLQVLLQIAETLAAMHRQGAVHGNLKPDNIIVLETSAGMQIRMIDFGMAPSSEKGPIVDSYSDMKAMGIIAFEMFAGVSPISGPDQPSWDHLKRSTPPGLHRLIKQLLQRDPALRPRAEAVVAQLVALQLRLMPRPTAPWPARGASEATPVMLDIGPSGATGEAQHRALGVDTVRATGVVVFAAALAAFVWFAWRGTGAGSAEQPSDRTLKVANGARLLDRQDPLLPTRVLENGRAQCVRYHYDDAVCVPAMELTIGGGETKPAHRVRLGTFWIDQHEYTCGQGAALLNALPNIRVEREKQPRLGARGEALALEWRFVYHRELFLLDLGDGRSCMKWDPKTGKFSAIEGHEKRPLDRVTERAAEYFCESEGKALPTRSQWEAATGGALYPYGGDEPRCDGVAFDQADPHGLRIPACKAKIKVVGARDVCTSPQDITPNGICDLAANVSEWTRDEYKAYAECDPICVEPRFPLPSDDGAWAEVRGGNWQTSKGQMLSKARTRILADEPFVALGFRCLRSN
jgi:formylglycine-generating enzyme required for sulfatase activity